MKTFRQWWIDKHGYDMPPLRGVASEAWHARDAEVAELRRERDELNRDYKLVISHLAEARSEVERLKIRIEQHRRALGYAVQGDILDDPTIQCGLCDAKAKELRHLRAQLARARDVVEHSQRVNKLIRSRVALKSPYYEATYELVVAHEGFFASLDDAKPEALGTVYKRAMDRLDALRGESHKTEPCDRTSDTSVVLHDAEHVTLPLETVRKVEEELEFFAACVPPAWKHHAAEALYLLRQHSRAEGGKA